MTVEQSMIRHMQNRVGGGVSPPDLSHHRHTGRVHGGSVNKNYVHELSIGFTKHS